MNSIIDQQRDNLDFKLTPYGEYIMGVDPISKDSKEGVVICFKNGSKLQVINSSKYSGKGAPFDEPL